MKGCYPEEGPIPEFIITTMEVKDMAKIIDLSKIKMSKEAMERYRDAMNILTDKLTLEEAEKVLEFVFYVIRGDVAMGLGLMDTESDDVPETPFFDEIDALYQKSHHECYFCDPGIDPLETEIGPDTYICPEHQLKAANLLTMFGIDPSKIFKYVTGPSKIQKTRVKKDVS